MNPPVGPPLTELAALPAQLVRTGWAAIDAAALRTLCDLDANAFAAWPRRWSGLPADAHLKDGGRYRRRRHGCFIVTADSVAGVPHRAHWQPLAYNALHGGIERWFEPLEASLVEDPAWPALLRGVARLADALRGPQRWFVEAHPFRIDTIDGIGRPTPEGAHRDGVDLVAVILVERHAVKGGETRVFDADGPHGVRFTLAEPLSTLLLDDARVIHETTPIQPLEPAHPGWRDTLVLTYRRGGFQGPGSDAQRTSP